jgi:hypothetical protein
MFVLDSPFFGNDKTGILVATIPDKTDVMPLKSGSVVKGISLIDYNIALAKYGVTTLLDIATEQTKELIEKFNKQVETYDSDKFKNQLQETSKDISDFTEEQKQKIEKEVLPEIKTLMDNTMKNFKQGEDSKKMEEVQKEHEGLKDSVSR